jgi:hypothetical protein
MNRFQSLSRLSGLCVINAQGEIAQFNTNRKLVRLSSLREALGPAGPQLLAAQLRDPIRAQHRIGLVYHAPTPKTWADETVLMVDAVLEKLYPTGATLMGKLTDFQKRNREKSLYRGFELLLEHTNPNAPGMRIFCPVIFSAGLNADAYPEFAESGTPDQAKATAVLEVLNLISLLPPGAHHSAAVTGLAEAIHAGVVRKDLRRSSGLTLLEDFRRAPETAPAVVGGFYDTDQRAERQLTITDPLADVVRERSPAQSPGHIADNPDRWLNIPHDSITPPILRRFDRFRLAPVCFTAACAIRVTCSCSKARLHLRPRMAASFWSKAVWNKPVTHSPR